LTDSEIELWSFVSPDKRVLPATSVRRTLRSGLSGLAERLRPTYILGEAEPFRPRDDLTPLSRRQLEGVVPPPDWQPACESLDRALEDWRGTWGEHQAAALLVAPPFSGHREMLSGLAQARGWQLIEPPSVPQILAGDHHWLSQFDGETPWVLPELSHCFLRHVHGLGLLRHFLSRVWSGEFGVGVIGCESWAWEYWRCVMPNLKPSQLTVQAMDHQRLGSWFQALADRSGRRPVRFRQADTGHWVLAERAENPLPPRGHKHSGFLKDLAAYSRGLPGVAWALWRLALRAEPETEVAASEESETAETAESGHQAAARSIWVTGWDMIKPPSVPQVMPPAAGLVLHALLLHGGLDAENLVRVTSLDADSVCQILHLLARAELIEDVPRGWSVTALGYPNVRRHLSGQGLPVDTF